MSSIHEVIVIPVNLKKHPDADLLGINDIFDGGYQCVCNLEDWAGRSKAYYVPPDNVVDTSRPEFSFLSSGAKSDGWARIKARKIRGIVSYGLMVPAPDDAIVGSDATELLNVKEYDPETMSGNAQKGPKLDMGETCAAPLGLTIPKYDVENFRKYHRVFQQGEHVVIREKIDGQNVKYVFKDGLMHCGSRNQWKRQYPKIDHLTLEYFMENGIPEDKAKHMVEVAKKRANSTNWVWQTKDSVEQDAIGSIGTIDGPIDTFCRAYPGYVLFGESYGNVGGMSYGLKNGLLKFAAFDVLKPDGQWMDAQEFHPTMESFDIPMAPTLNQLYPACLGGSIIIPIEYDFDKVLELCNGMSLLCPTQIKEGVVVTSLKERYVHSVGRAQLKAISPTYSEKKK